MTPRRRQFLIIALNWIGGAIAVAAVVAVGRDLVEYANQIDVSRISPVFWTLVLTMALVYGAVSPMLARAWWHLVRSRSIESDFGDALRIYGISQLGKYVPGNVAQVIGRQALAQSAGYDGIDVAKTAVIEVVLMVVAAITLAMIAVPLAVSAVPAVAGPVLFVVFVAMFSYLTGSTGGAHLRRAYLWTLLFLTINGVLFYVLVVLVEPVSLALAPVVAGAYVTAWLIGYVAPGAPAGIGIREVAVGYLLAGEVGAATLSLAVVLGRVVTIIGDLAFFAVAVWLGSRAGSPARRMEARSDARPDPDPEADAAQNTTK